MNRTKNGIPNDQVLAEELEDPEFRSRWERTALAREVAMALVTYRAEHGLSQRQLAAQLGYRQPQVSRLEDGETLPTVDTLVHLARTLKLRIRLDVEPGHVSAQVLEDQPA